MMLNKHPLWIEDLAQFLANEQEIRAVKINPDTKTISLSTVGNINTDFFQDKLNQVLLELENKFSQKNNHSFTQIIHSISTRSQTHQSLINSIQTYY